MPTHHGPIIATRDGLTVIDCRVCGWAHLDPLPVVDDAYYREHFWSEKGAGWLARYEAERDWLDMRHGDWLSVVEEHTGGRTLLDVGCGYGFLMRAARDRDWHATGIEPSCEAAKYAADLTGCVIDERLWEKSGGGHFGCISALWLMEHLADPPAFLAWCRAHLAPGGVLLLAVPNEWNQYQHWANELGKCRRDFWLHPTHLNYWSAPTLYGMLGRAGFSVVDALASWPIEFELIQDNDYTRDDAMGDKVHAEIRKAELSMSQPERIERGRMLARQSIGRDLIVVAK